MQSPADWRLEAFGINHQEFAKFSTELALGRWAVGVLGAVLMVSSGSCCQAPPTTASPSLVASPTALTPLPSDLDPTRPPQPTATATLLIVVPTQTTTVEPQSGPLTWSGSGSERTRSFRLGSGEYAITWQARPILPSGIGCTLLGSLRGTDGDQVNAAFEGEVVPGANLFSGAERGYNLPAGEYLMDVRTDCIWTVTLVLTQS
jgi:hypothetical protein